MNVLLKIIYILNRGVKIKSKEADCTINYWVDYTNEKGKPSRGCQKPAFKCFYSFYFSVKNGRWDTITQKCIYAYNLQNVTGIYLSESCKKSNGVSAEKIQIFAMFNLPRRQNEIFHSFEICLYVRMYLFAIDKKSLKIVHSPPINKTK